MPSVLLDTLEPDIFRITLNRPESLNAIDGTLIRGIDEAFGEAEASPDARVVVLTGAGRGFCSGADLRGGEPWLPPARTALKTMYNAQVRLTDLMQRIYESPLPVIAAVNGVAVGGGLAFALHCDVRIAASSARFGSAFIKAGFSSLDMGVSYLLPRIAGAGKAREMMLTGRVIDSAEAERCGLVHEVVPDADLLPAAVRMARLIADNNEYGVWQTKIGLNVALDAPSLRHAKEIENRTQVLSAQTGNAGEAGRALTEKRPPQWKRL